MTQLGIVIRVIVIIIVAFILIYGAVSYIDEIVKSKHDEMMRNYKHSCNGGLTDEEAKEITKEDGE